ncbi:hypothetical protein I3843_01G102100 [Carya illinoinensis]|nr:hypothetical protein I3843_01G102100 [Carya illinoinensis]
MIQNNETRSNNLGECYPIKLEEKLDEISIESSTSADRTILRELYDLALRFFSDHLPLEWHVDSESFDNSTEMIASVYLAREALTLSRSRMVWDLSMLGFRFKDTKFEHLLGLIHAAICISIIDIDIGFGARERLKARESQRHGFQVNMAEKPEFEVKMEEIKGWESVPYSSELQEAGVGLDMAKKLRDDVFEFGRWLTIPYAFEFQEAGIEFKKAKELTDTHFYGYWNEDEMDGVELKTKFKRLICPDKIDRWKSIPYGKVLRGAGVEFNKAEQFKRLFDLREFDDWNIHGATELEEAGIKFKTARRPGFSIKFDNGLMEISPLTIEDHTETYLRNLIAYEQYCDEDIGFDLNYVTNYVRFMDDLINSPKDVQLLRRRRIIRNLLGDDEVVSNTFKRLGQHITISTSSSVYARTSMAVNMHCSKRWNVWVAKLRREYFGSPWALLSFLAALLLLALAITQTIFSIIP